MSSEVQQHGNEYPRLPIPAYWQRHEDATGTEVGPCTPWFSVEQMRAAHAERDSAQAEAKHLAMVNAELLDQMHHFANADQRLWDESQRDPESFKSWVRSRAAHLLRKFNDRATLTNPRAGETA